MSLLAEFLQFNDPPPFYLLSKSGSTIVKYLKQYGLAPDIQKSYQMAKKLYKSFYMLIRLLPYPATNQILEEWSAYCFFGSNLPKQSQIKPDTIVSYLLGLQFQHVNYHLLLTIFDNLRLAQIIKRERRLFPNIKTKQLSITKDIFKIIILQSIMSIEKCNINIIFKIVWAGFLRLGEIIYTNTKLKKLAFADIHTTRSNISFIKSNQYAVLRLKRSKTDIKHSGVQIILAATRKNTCLVTSLYHLFLTGS